MVNHRLGSWCGAPLWGGGYDSSETCSWAQRLSFFLVKRAGYWRGPLALCLDLSGAERGCAGGAYKEEVCEGVGLSSPAIPLS